MTCCSELLVSVHCHNKPINAVVEVDLSNNSLHGELHDALILLQEVQVLSFSENALTGRINGPTLSHLPNLAMLYFQHNELTGTIPKELRKYEKLGKSNSFIVLYKPVSFSGILTRLTRGTV